MAGGRWQSEETKEMKQRNGNTKDVGNACRAQCSHPVRGLTPSLVPSAGRSEVIRHVSEEGFGVILFGPAFRIRFPLGPVPS